MPFPRLITAVDDWARTRGCEAIFAQIGPTEDQPSSIRFERFIQPAAFQRLMLECDLVVSHAGMGTILSALTMKRPIIVMPRRGDLEETRNDHQIGTARRFGEAGHVAVAMSEPDLVHLLDHPELVPRPRGISDFASSELLSTIERFVGESSETNDRSSSAGRSRAID